MPTSDLPIDPPVPPQPGAALVVARWNAWARVWFPDTGETTWVNLEQVGFETVPDAGPVVGECD